MISITEAIKNGFYNTFCLKDRRMLVPLVGFFIVALFSTFISDSIYGESFLQSNVASGTNMVLTNQVSLLLEWALPASIAASLISLFFIGFTVIAYASKKNRDSWKIAKDTAKHYLGLLAVSILLVIILTAGLIAFIIPGVFLAAKLAFSQLFTLLDKKSPGKALSASYNMTNGRFWDVLAMLLVVVFITSIVESTASVLLLLQPFAVVYNVVEMVIGAFFTVAIISVIADYFLQINRKIRI